MPSRKAFLKGSAAVLMAASLPRFSLAKAVANGVTEIAPGIFVHQGAYAMANPENAGDIANASIVVGDQSVAVIDTGGSAQNGRAIRAAVRAITDKPIRYVINTHMHPDHVLGNIAFSEDSPEFVAHHKMARGLAARAEFYMKANAAELGAAAFEGTKIVLPTNGVEDQLTLDLGGRTLELHARPTAHTDNDLTIYDSATGTLFLGDLLFAKRIPTIDGSVLGWLKLLDTLKAQAAARVVPGHGPQSMEWPSGAAAMERYLQTLVTDVRALIKGSKSIADATKTAAQSERDSWLLFDDNNARNVTAAFAELEWE